MRQSRESYKAKLDAMLYLAMVLLCLGVITACSQCFVSQEVILKAITK